jgi:hypothetical protein
MPHLLSKIGRGLIPVQVEYNADYDTDDSGRQYIDIEIIAVDMYASAADKSRRSFTDVSGLLTDSVFASLESDCKAHEINERARLADGDSLEPELDTIGGY